MCVHTTYIGCTYSVRYAPSAHRAMRCAQSCESMDSGTRLSVCAVMRSLSAFPMKWRSVVVSMRRCRDSVGGTWS